MGTPITCRRNRTALALLTVAAVLSSNSSKAQLKPVDHGAAAIDSHGLMWANTVGIALGWNPNGGPGTAQAWVANLNATDYGGFNDWVLPTGDFHVGPNTTTNQLGELFYTDCGNAVGKQTSLTIPGNNCRALSSLGPAINMGLGGLPGGIIISSSTFLGLIPPQGYYSWTVYGTFGSEESYYDSDTAFGSAVGLADVLAVRLAGVKPQIANASGTREFGVPEPNTLALLGMGMVGLVLRWWGDRRRPI